MENARVIIIEDHEPIRELAATLLEMHGHEVTGTATTIAEARALIGRIAAGEVACNVAVCDGKLSPDAESMSDLMTVTEEIRKYGLTEQISVIGFSSDDPRDYGVKTARNLPKEQITHIGDVVDEL